MSPTSASRIGYLGPAGSWTHQACLDLFDADRLVPLTCDELFARYASEDIDLACIPVTTSLVGVTPYLDAVIDLPDVVIVAEYTKMLGYSLLVRAGTRLTDLEEVLAHPVALDEVRPWLDRHLPAVRRTGVASGGAAAQAVASSHGHDKASFGPRIGADIHSLVSLADGIEEGPHNVTRWWLLGRDMPVPTGRDKTSLLIETCDDRFGARLAALIIAGVRILAIYERPSRKTLDTHRYLVEVSGHVQDDTLACALKADPGIRVLGSYPRGQMAYR